jgi:hypothetical protein
VWVFCIILGVIIVLIGLVMTSATPDMKDGYFVIAMGVMLSVASILNIKANTSYNRLTTCRGNGVFSLLLSGQIDH